MLPNFLTKLFGSRNDRLLKSYRRVVEQINALEPALERLDDAALRARTDEFRERLAKGQGKRRGRPPQWLVEARKRTDATGAEPAQAAPAPAPAKSNGKVRAAG